MASVTENIIKAHVEAIRPPVELRDKIDTGYSFEKNTLIVFEKTPYYLDESKIIETPVIKARYVKTQRVWKLYWMRGNLKWYPYEPFPEAKDIDTIFRVLKEDANNCFYG